ncbi:MAG: hypothetical protein PUP91_05910 [Rhizonema sp. PD37]|nr:hypothetical protein [Rhizonema sp. PD37]
MKINQALVVIAIPVLIGTFGFVAPHQANAEASFHKIAQAPEPPSQPPNGPKRPPRIDFAAAARKLGVTEAQLKNALGVPANPPSPPSPPNQADKNKRPPRPNFKAAAAKLGVSEKQLTDALGVPPHLKSDRPAPPANQ